MITITTELEVTIPQSAGLFADEDALYEALIEALTQALANLGATEDDVTIKYVDIEGLHDEED